MRIKVLRNLPLKPGRPEGEQRYEGREYDVSNKEGAKLIAAGLAVDLTRPTPPPEPEPESETETEAEPADELEALTVAQLKEVAADENVPLTSHRRADVLAAIQAARIARAKSVGE